MDNSADVRLIAELDYRKALTQLEEFKTKFRGIDLGDFQAASRQIKGAADQMAQMTAQMRTAAAEMDSIRTGTLQQTEAVKVGGRESSKVARDQQAQARIAIKDAEYLNKTLNQRVAIWQRLDTLMRSPSFAKSGEEGKDILARRYGSSAIADYQRGQLASTNASTQALKLQSEQYKELDKSARAFAKQGDRMLGQFYASQAAEAQRYQSTLESMQKRSIGASVANAQAYARSYQQGQKNVVASISEVTKARTDQDRETRRYYQSLESLESRAAAASQSNAREYARSYQRGMSQVSALQSQSVKSRDDAQQDYNRRVAANGNSMLQMFERQKASEAAAQAAATNAAKENLQIGKFREQSLATQVRLLRQIAAAEQSSIARGQGGMLSNPALRKTLTSGFGAGAVGAYETGELSRAVRALTAEQAANAASKSFESASELRRRKLREEAAAARRAQADYREFHSAARGLGGASGMLWMTYGSMLPLAMGAGVAGAARGQIRQGGQMSENMAFVRQLSEDNAGSTEQLNSQMADTRQALLEMSRASRFGAVEMSESMRVLAQANYGAAEALKMLPSVFNLSVIGETTPENAALAMAGTLSAYNLGPDSAPRVADVLSIAAARSQTDVVKLMESMKQASTVAQDYGSTLEETSAVLTLLARRNITGSAAGTAFRNMMVDLAGRTPKSTAAIEKLGVSLYDTATRRARPLREVLTDIIEKMSKMDQASRNNARQAIFNERGSRPIAALTSSGEVDFNELVDDLNRSGRNGGFAARQAEALSTTPIAEYQKAVNNMTASLIEGFNQSENELKNFAKAMQDAFNSPEFRSFADGMAVSIASMADFVRYAAPVLKVGGQILLLYGASKIAAGAYAVAMGFATKAKVGLTVAIAASRNTLVAYNMMSAISASTTVGLGAAATTAARGMKALMVSLGPLGVAMAAVATIATAYTLLADSAERVAKVKLTPQQLTPPVDPYEYEAFAKAYDSAIDTAMNKSGAFSKGAVRNLDDVFKQAKDGEAGITAVRAQAIKERGELDAAGQMFFLDRERELQRQLQDEAARYAGQSKEDREKLTKFAEQAADAEVRIQAAAMNMMVENAATAAAAQIASAAGVVSAWERAWNVSRGMAGGMINSVSGLFGEGTNYADTGAAVTALEQRAREQEAARRQVEAQMAELRNKNKAGVTAMEHDVYTAAGVLKAAKSLGVDTSEDQKVIDNQIRLNQELRRTATQNRITAERGTGEDRYDRPTNTRADRSDSNAARLRLAILKDETRQAEEMLRIRDRLSLYTSEEMYSAVETLKIKEATQEYEAQRQRALYEIQKAEKAGNAAAIKDMKDSLVLSEVLQESKIKELQTAAATARYLRDEKRALEDLNVAMQARQRIFSAMNALYGSFSGHRARELSQLGLAATIDRARYDQAKQMQQLAGSSNEVRELATEANRLALAQQIFDLRKEEQRLLFDNAKSAREVNQAILNSLSAEIAELERQRTTMDQDIVTGLSSGLQTTNRALFEYIKNPRAYKEANGGRSYGAGEMAAGVGEAIFDQIAGSLSRSMTQSTLGMLQQAFTGMGLETPGQAAERMASEAINMNTANMAQALGVTIPQLLLDIHNAVLSTSSNGVIPQAGSSAGATIGQGAYGMQAGAVDPAKNMADAATSTQNALQSMGMTATQVFGMMYMGVNAFATGGIKEFARFAAGAIAQMLAVWAVQKLIGLAAGAAGGGASAAGGATALPVSMPAPSFAVPLADGTSFVNARRPSGMVRGPGGPRDDVIPAWLSHGEAVINAAAVDYYGPAMIEAMNLRKIPMRNFADGGMIAAATSGYRSSSGGGGNTNFAFHLGETQSGAPDAKDNRLMEDLETAVLGVMRKHGRSGGAFSREVISIVNRGS